MSSLSPEEQIFNYEDFCTDLSNYLLLHEEEFLGYFPGKSDRVVYRNKLAIVLSKFWHEKGVGDAHSM